MSETTPGPMTLERAKEILFKFTVGTTREMLDNPDDIESLRKEAGEAAKELGISHEETLALIDFLVDEAQKNQV